VIRALRPLGGIALAFLIAAPAAAQGRVAGTVRDAEDHPIKGATITAENPNAAPSTFVATSDSKGRFGFLGLRSGQWALTAEAPGYETARVRVVARMLTPSLPVQFVLTRVRQIAPPGPLAAVDVGALQKRLDEAEALDAAGKLDEAIERYKDIVSHLPALTSVHLQLGSLYERKHDTASASAEYQSVLKTDPGNAKARAALDRLARQ